LIYICFECFVIVTIYCVIWMKVMVPTKTSTVGYENMELKEALEEERSFSDRLLEDIDRVLDMLERHLPRQLLHLVDKARELLPEHQTYRQQQQRERGHSWDDMSL